MNFTRYLKKYLGVTSVAETIKKYVLGYLGRLDYELGMAEDRIQWRRHIVGEAKIHLEIVWPEE